MTPDDPSAVSPSAHHPSTAAPSPDGRPGAAAAPDDPATGSGARPSPVSGAARARLLAIHDDAAALADRLQRDMQAVAEAREGANVDDEHDPEGSTIAYERSQLDAVRRSALDRAADAEAALRRLDDGTFGRCERCSARIGEARLTARPTARLCIDCAT